MEFRLLVYRAANEAIGLADAARRRIEAPSPEAIRIRAFVVELESNRIKVLSARTATELRASSKELVATSERLLADPLVSGQFDAFIRGLYEGLSDHVQNIVAHPDYQPPKGTQGGSSSGG